MEIKLERTTGISDKSSLAILIENKKEIQQFLSDTDEANYIQDKLEKNNIASIIKSGHLLCFIQLKKVQNPLHKKELLRRSGFDLATLCQRENIKEIQLAGEEDDTIDIAEGLMLSAYRFEKYKTKKNLFPLKSIVFTNDASKDKIKELKNVVKATYISRDLVNEPVVFLTATDFSEEIKNIGEDAGFSVEVLNKKKIESLKMGGLLAVNKGSIDPPTFNILEYKPDNAINKKPYVLVGKGVVYDTGGLSLKPSESMLLMKCDMAGGAAVVGALYAIAKNKLPIHIVGLIPATDNRPGGNAITPGDVITISNGKTVEIINTDAEGRLILADALVYASRYKPELVIDLATLTGAALRAIGPEGIVFMGTASEKMKSNLKESGEEVYERLVEFPFWEEYEKQIESDIADIKNLGGDTAGAITAGKFLEKFVDYEWLHLDIAGPAFLGANDYYRTKNATGVGVRLLYNFFKNIK